MGLIVPNGIHDAKAVIAVNTSGDYQPIGGGSSGGGTITGPGSSTNTALVRWNGTAGTAIQDSNITSNGNNLSFPDGGSLILASNTVPANIGSSTANYNTVWTSRIAASIISGLNAAVLTITSDKGVNIYAAQGQVGNFITTSGTILPKVSGVDSIGATATPYNTGYFNQYATTRFSGNITASTYTINWSNGSSQAIGFNAGFVTGVTISLVNGIPGSSYSLEVYNNPSGTANITWGNNVKWQQGISGICTTSGNAQDLFTFYSKDNNVYYGNSSYNFK